MRCCATHATYTVRTLRSESPVISTALHACTDAIVLRHWPQQSRVSCPHRALHTVDHTPIFPALSHPAYLCTIMPPRTKRNKPPAAHARIKRRDARRAPAREPRATSTEGPDEISLADVVVDGTAQIRARLERFTGQCVEVEKASADRSWQMLRSVHALAAVRSQAGSSRRRSLRYVSFDAVQSAQQALQESLSKSASASSACKRASTAVQRARWVCAHQDGLRGSET